MKVLFVSNELIGSGLLFRLVRESHDVRLFINDPARKNCLDGLVTKVPDWKKELHWVGKDGLIVFDDVGFGSEQDKLRKRGYTVFGGTKEGDRLELDRGYAQRILHGHKIKILPSFNFKDIDQAISFLKENKGKWVVKQNSHISSLNLVGTRSDALDIIRRLQRYKKLGVTTTHLQKRAEGIEVGIARYFNGTDWVGPIEINHEHKRLNNGDTGSLTAEMGTVIWHSLDENLPLFARTLKILTPYLAKIGYKGDIDINCIVTKNDIWPLELTPRLGTPATQLHSELYTSSMGDLIYAVAEGKQTIVKHKPGFGIVVALSVLPFPYPPKKKRSNSKKRVLTLSPKMSEEDKDALYLEEISMKKNSDGSNELFWSGEFGYVGYITASGKTITEAQTKIKKRLSMVQMPGLIYRTDIGHRVKKHDLPQLKKWGWI
jgi:phosphoribosylamine--glycine ligase